MYVQATERLRPGDVLAKTVYDDNARPLLRAGVTLDAKLIESLAARGCASVYLRDGLADDVVPDTLVEEQIRAEIARNLSDTFDGITADAMSVTETAPDVAAALDRLGPNPIPLTDRTQQQLKAMHAQAASLVEQIVDAPTAGRLASLKAHSTYTFQHSVDVAVIGVLLGVQAGLSIVELRDLAVGCLLHDIGKRFIDEAILDYAGPLSREQRAIIEQHPFMGFELVRRLPLGSILPPHVAYQHHERQNGTGYPRGLRGSNRIMRQSAERLQPKRMLLIAEIAAVADVYSAIASDRPYRSAMPPEKVADILLTMAGPHLNEEIVALFMRSVPLYPVGLWVTITTGAHRGRMGVVVGQNSHELHRPRVRLLIDAGGEALAEPVEFDLAADPGVMVESLNPGRSPLLSRSSEAV
ncbi:MAG TPA: HD domain-containing phosphohydrolase [Egibacteraceae bacterium]|nr:HD domain-containing phosphohydrolase [Egibacteraceae bacterium]